VKQVSQQSKAAIQQYGEIVTRTDRFRATVNVQENKRLKQALVSRFKTTP
jgi:hypothetical protein